MNAARSFWAGDGGGKVWGCRVRRKQGEILIRAFVPRKLSARSGLLDGEVEFGCLLQSCNWAGVGKSWGKISYADARPVVECWGGEVRSV